MELLILETEEEENFMVNLLEKNSNFLDTFTHIGGTILGSNNWYWASTGQPINYQIRWAPREPNNPTTEFCLSFLKKADNTFGINDIRCNAIDQPLGFICEKKAIINCNQGRINKFTPKPILTKNCYSRPKSVVPLRKYTSSCKLQLVI